MSRLNDWIQLLDDPGHVLEGSHPSDAPLTAMLVHLAFADGVVQDDELAFFERLMPGLSPSEVGRRVEALAVRPVDLAAIDGLVATPEDRHALLAAAARMVGLDGAVATEEVVHLHRIIDHLGLDRDTLRRALDEVVAPGGPVSPAQVTDAVAHQPWDHLIVLPGAEGPQGGALIVLARPGRGDPEVAVYADALWAHFASGPGWVPWADIVSYTRLPVRGRAFHVRTDAADHTLVDASFRDLGRLLDRVYGRTED